MEMPESHTKMSDEAQNYLAVNRILSLAQPDPAKGLHFYIILWILPSAF